MTIEFKKSNDSKATIVIDSIVDRIINKYEFELDNNNSYTKDGVSKVLFKNNLEILLIWDWRETEITFRFKKRNVNHIGVDFRRIRSKYLQYEGIVALNKYLDNISCRDYNIFDSKAKENQLHEFLNDWVRKFPLLFENGDYSRISQLEDKGHGNPEDMKKERELIKRFYEKYKNNS